MNERMNQPTNILYFITEVRIRSQTAHGVLREERSNLGYLATSVPKSVSLL